MKKITITNYKELAQKMIDLSEVGETAYAVCFYDDAICIMKELMKNDNIDIASVVISPFEYNGYEKEYYISLDGNSVLDIEPAWHDDNEYHKAGYLWFDADVVYIDSNANSAILKCIDDSHCVETEFNICTEKESYDGEDEVVLCISLDDLFDILFGE